MEAEAAARARGRSGCGARGRRARAWPAWGDEEEEEEARCATTTVSLGAAAGANCSDGYCASGGARSDGAKEVVRRRLPALSPITAGVAVIIVSPAQAAVVSYMLHIDGERRKRDAGRLALPARPRRRRQRCW